ncbi:MAG: hypothetical protein DRJ09_02780 [Bacteroidetes bacterium]|nr:MAG: hypothetical protein DRJ09_02780 [Bacteroidota bacterium]
MDNIFSIKAVSIYLVGFLAFFTFCDSKQNIKAEKQLNALERITIQKKHINTYKDIEPVTDSLVKPIDYLNVISLKSLPVKEKKKYFIDLILPAILIAKEEYKERLEWVNHAASLDTLSPGDQQILTDLLKTYRAKSVEDLQLRLITHPTSIVLAQASIESGWGTSRFFVDADNVFGVWSFNDSDPRIPSLSTRNGKHMYLYKYSSLSESIDDYFKLLATRSPFRAFRNARAKTNNPYKLVEYLTDYSELGEEYVAALKTQIRHNNFTRYDYYQTDPTYFNNK